MSACSANNTRPALPGGCGPIPMPIPHPGHHHGCCPHACPCAQMQDGSLCGRYVQPICTSAAQYPPSAAENGATLVIHMIVLEPCGNQSCTPRTFKIRITGPSYPCGEVFTLTAGSCITLDEPLVLTGLEPGTYCIEEIFACPHAYVSTYTGPVHGRCVCVGSGYAPTVITIVNRKRLCALCHGYGCGCAAHSICR